MENKEMKPWYTRAKDAIKNKKLVYAGAAVMATCIGLAFVKDCNCGGSRGVTRHEQAPAPMCEPLRADDRCCESEASPYMLNPDFSFKLANGQRVPNPLYDPESCHWGDNVCQKGADRSNIPGPFGFVIRDLRQTYTDGRPVPFPLENDQSRDCVMQVVREQPCAQLAPDRSNVLRRPRVFFPQGAPRTIRDKTRAELDTLGQHPESLARGDNHTQVVDNYEELCIDPNMPMCNADIPIACNCPNHPDCDPCGNGTIDTNAGEICDTRATPSGCGPGKRCAAGCRQCVPIASHSECRNQQCVTVPGAGRDRCSSDTDCRTPPPTHNECRDQQCVTVQGAGPNRCSVNTDCETPQHTECQESRCVTVPGAGSDACSSDAQCGTIGPCRSEVSGQVCGEAMNSLISNAPAVRSAAGVGNTTDVGVNAFTITVRQGRPQTPTVSLRPTGTYSGARIAARFGMDVTCVASCGGGTVPGERQ